MKNEQIGFASILTYCKDRHTHCFAIAECDYPKNKFTFNNEWCPRRGRS